MIGRRPSLLVIRIVACAAAGAAIAALHADIAAVAVIAAAVIGLEPSLQHSTMASDTDVPRGRAATRRVGILLSGLLLSCLTGYATFRAATLVPQHQAEPTLSIAAGVLLALGIRYVVRRPAVISRRRMQLELATVFALMIAVPLPGHTGLPPWLELGCDAYLLAWAGSFIVEQITHRGGCVRLPAPSP